MNTNLILKIVLGLVVIGGAVLVYQKLSMENVSDEEMKMLEEKLMMEQEDLMMKQEEDSMMKKEDAMVEGDDAMMKKEDAMVEGDEAMMKKEDAMVVGDDVMEKKDDMMEKKTSGQYIKYENFDIKNSTDITVLNFYATWCPSCKVLKKDIIESVSDIPSNVTIVEVDYDIYGDLKKKYGISSQHTLVQIDKDGNEVKKWLGGIALEDVLKNIQY